MDSATGLKEQVDFAALAEFRYQLRLFLRASEEAVRDAGIEPQHHQLMLAVKGAESSDVTIGYLSERLQLKHHSTVGLVDRLVERGLVERIRSADDRRRVHVRLTSRGEAVLESLAKDHVEMLRSGEGLARALNALIRERLH